MIRDRLIGGLWINDDAYSILHGCAAAFDLSLAQALEMALYTLDKELSKDKNSLLYNKYMEHR